MSPFEIPDGAIGDEQAVELIDRLVADRLAELRAEPTIVVAPIVLLVTAGGRGRR